MCAHERTRVAICMGYEGVLMGKGYSYVHLRPLVTTGVS